MHDQPLAPSRKLSEKLEAALARHGDLPGADERTQLKAGVRLYETEGISAFDPTSPADVSALDTFRFAHAGFVDIEAGGNSGGLVPSISEIRRGEALSVAGEMLERFLTRSWIDPVSGLQAGDWFVTDANRQPTNNSEVPLSNRLDVRDAATGLLLAEVEGQAEPTVEDLVHVLRRAIATFGKPRRAVVLSSPVWCAVNCPSFTHYRKGEFPAISLPAISKADRADIERWLSDQGIAATFTYDSVNGNAPLVNAERSDDHHKTTELNELSFY